MIELVVGAAIMFVGVLLGGAIVMTARDKPKEEPKELFSYLKDPKINKEI